MVEFLDMSPRSSPSSCKEFWTLISLFVFKHKLVPPQPKLINNHSYHLGAKVWETKDLLEDTSSTQQYHP
ncbi:hypothetical protein HKD37_13G038127 [Glycine soja]